MTGAPLAISAHSGQTTRVYEDSRATRRNSVESGISGNGRLNRRRGRPTPIPQASWLPPIISAPAKRVLCPQVARTRRFGPGRNIGAAIPLRTGAPAATRGGVWKAHGRSTSGQLKFTGSPANLCHSERSAESAFAAVQRVARSRFLVACAPPNDTVPLPATCSSASASLFARRSSGSHRLPARRRADR